MIINDEIIDEVVASCRDKFRTLDLVSQYSEAPWIISPKSACFAAGVNIRDVVKHVLYAYNKARYKPVDKP